MGTAATVVPLTVAAAPYVARLVEISLREMDRGVVEAAQSMGCSPWQIATKVMLPECRPSLINGATNAAITILGYGAMAGAIGGGGLGAVALMRGHGRNQVCGGDHPGDPGPDHPIHRYRLVGEVRPAYQSNRNKKENVT